MAQKKSKSKLRKLNFVNRDRRIELISETDKYLLSTIEKLKPTEPPKRRTQYA
tara:strand:- start:15 stop:173 length:159 start_codon:yes stop_codon:yes gene_type:complete